jgi:hypothetical protein
MATKTLVYNIPLEELQARLETADIVLTDENLVTFIFDERGCRLKCGEQDCTKHHYSVVGSAMLWLLGMKKFHLVKRTLAKFLIKDAETMLTIFMIFMGCNKSQKTYSFLTILYFFDSNNTKIEFVKIYYIVKEIYDRILFCSI